MSEVLYEFRTIVATLLFWEEINEIKTYRPAAMEPALSVSHVASLDEGETLLTHTKPNHPRKNSYEFVENLCCTTADIERSLAYIPEQEWFNLLVEIEQLRMLLDRTRPELGQDWFDEITMPEEAGATIQKLYQILNYGPGYYE